jgi:hypothetical protein
VFHQNETCQRDYSARQHHGQAVTVGSKDLREWLSKSRPYALPGYPELLFSGVIQEDRSPNAEFPGGHIALIAEYSDRG